MIELRWLKAEGVFRPLADSQQYCNENYTDGQVIKFEEVEEQSDPSRKHFFACVGTVWDNLKEPDRKQFESREHLRHWVVIQAGYYTCEEIVAMSPVQAAQLAIQMGKWAKQWNPYAIITVRNKVVRMYNARSLKKRGKNALTKQEFQDMKEKALVILSDLIGIDVDVLLRNVPMPADDQPGAKPNGRAEPAPEPEPIMQSHDEFVDAYDNWIISR